jgi:Acetyltransferase (GNAT) domain
VASRNAEGAVRLRLDDPRWRQFVADRPDATVLHEPAWADFLAECYGFESFALAEVRDELVIAGLPVIEVRKPLTRRKWLSLPFTDECGPLGGDGSDRFIHMIDAAREEAEVPSHEIRAQVTGGHQRPRGYSNRLVLQEDVDAQMRGYRSSIRQGIRVAAREGVTVRHAETRSDLTQIFYRLHVATRRRLGVPVQRRRFFELLWDRLIAPSHGFVLIAEWNGLPLSAAVFLQGHRDVQYKYGASDAQHWNVRANTALFHDAIRRSGEAGCTIFDWGRTDRHDEGLRRFKASWGGSEDTLVYTTLGKAPSPEREASRAGELARVVIRKSPASVCRAAGALLYRYAA